MTATGNRGEIGFGDRDPALKQTFVPPLAVRRHPYVTEAIGKVLRQMIRGGHRKVAGVKIWSETKSTVR